MRTAAPPASRLSGRRPLGREDPPVARRSPSATTSRAICSTRAARRCASSCAARSPTCGTAASRRRWPASSPTCVVNGQPAAAAIFKLDDRSGAIEAVVAEAAQRQRQAAQDDELLILTGKVSPTASAAACASTCSRSRTWPGTLPPCALPARGGRAHAAAARRGAGRAPARRGRRSTATLVGACRCACTSSARPPSATSTSATPSRFWPSDEALAQWAAQCGAGGAAHLHRGTAPAELKPAPADARAEASDIHARPHLREIDPENRARRRGFTLLTFIGLTSPCMPAYSTGMIVRPDD